MRQHRLYISILFFCFVLTVQAQDVNDQNVEAQEVSVRENLVQETTVELYPNPAVDFLVVQVSSESLDNVKFEIRSLLGTQMLVTPEILGDGRYRFPVKDFATGYYFVVVEDETTKKAQRFLKR
ncbi:MAG: T9SS type A sorting domain-containing protein [Bacteroidota bacterium]